MDRKRSLCGNISQIYSLVLMISFFSIGANALVSLCRDFATRCRFLSSLPFPNSSVQQHNLNGSFSRTFCFYLLLLLFLSSSEILVRIFNVLDYHVGYRMNGINSLIFILLAQGCQLSEGFNTHQQKGPLVYVLGLYITLCYTLPAWIDLYKYGIGL